MSAPESLHSSRPRSTPVADCDSARCIVFDYPDDGRYVSVYVSRAVFDAVPGGRVSEWARVWSKKTSKRVTFYTREEPKE